MRSFFRGAKLRQWLGRSDCPKVINECGAILDNIYDGVIEPDDMVGKQVTLPNELALKIGSKTGMLRAHHRTNGVVFSRASTHVGNSLVIYSPNHDPQLPDVYASIQYIFRLSQNEEWRFAVKMQPGIPGSRDPFSSWSDYPASMKLRKLDDTLELVNMNWVHSQYARWAVSEEHVFTLPLRPVSPLFPTRHGSYLYCLRIKLL